MTVTDVKISTDLDGTEHWERRYTATSKGTVNFNINLTTNVHSTWQALYGDYDDPPASAPGVNQGIFFSGSGIFTYFASLDYYDAFDVILPDTAVAGDRLFRMKWSAFHLDLPDITLIVDLFTGLTDGLRPDASVHSDIENICDDPPVMRIIPDQDVSAAVTDVINDATTVLDTDTWLALLAAGDEFGVRYTIYPTLLTLAETADFLESVTMVQSDPDDDAYTGIMFVQQFTIPGAPTEAPQPRIQQPHFHNARRVLAAHRQHGVIIGRRPH
jgi:hypothetical protein